LIAGYEPVKDALVVVVDDEETQAIDLLDAANMTVAVACGALVPLWAREPRRSS